MLTLSIAYKGDVLLLNRVDFQNLFCFWISCYDDLCDSNKNENFRRRESIHFVDFKFRQRLLRHYIVVPVEFIFKLTLQLWYLEDVQGVVVDIFKNGINEFKKWFIFFRDSLRDLCDFNDLISLSDELHPVIEAVSSRLKFHIYDIFVFLDTENSAFDFFKFIDTLSLF